MSSESMEATTSAQAEQNGAESNNRVEDKDKKHSSSSSSRSHRRESGEKRKREDKSKSSRSSDSSKKRRSRSPKREGSRRDEDRDRKDRDRKERKDSDRRDRDRDRDRKDRDRKEKGRDRKESDRDRRKEDHKRKREDEKEEESNKKEKREETNKEEEEKKVAAAAAAKEREEENNRLEEAMKRRKELVEAWRAARRKENDEKETDEQATQRKQWSLEDEDEDEDEEAPAAKVETNAEPAPETASLVSPPPQTEQVEAPKAAIETMETTEEPEVDPLDMYMVDIQKEVAKLGGTTTVSTVASTKSSKVVKVEGVAMSGSSASSSTKNTIRSKLGDRFYAEDEDEDWAETEESDDPLVLAQKKKTKVIPAIDHSTIHYDHFEKNFYIEVPEIKRMTKEEVKAYRKEFLEDVKVRGKGCPKPIKEFSQCGLSSKMYAVLKHHGFKKPTPIQAQAIPAIMSGRDIIGCAKTGSGKTLAFLLPMLRHIMAQRRVEPGEGPIGLVMAPTRELAMQIYSDYKKFSKTVGFTVTCVYGGSVVADQISKLKRGADVVVCTPGRMIDILCTNNGRICNMKRVTFVVLDEADRMFDMGFEPQIMRIIENIRPSRQTVMFSATFPRSVETAARKILKKPLELVVGSRSTVCNDVTQHIEVRSEESKLQRLMELLEVWQDKGSILIFVDTQDSVDELYCELLKRGHPCLSLHGGHDQADRDSTITEFKKGTKTILIATSLMARGLDVAELNLVINFDCPNHMEDYVHRVGRTGRAGRKGWAYTFITPEEEKYAPDLMKALKASKAEIPNELQLLADGFKDKKTAGLVQDHGSGFGGKGHMFNETESMKKKKAIKQQKKALGIDDDDEESEESEEEAPAVEEEEKGVIRKVGGTEPITQTIAGVPVKLPPGVQFPMVGKTVQEQALQQVITPTPGMASAQLEAAKKAAMLAQIISQRKNLVSSSKQGLAERFESELEINDYPQQARWKVTHKDALSQITEMTGAAITTRGTFVKTGSNPPAGERKLYLFIEGPTESAVKQARTEIKRILEEATLLGNPQFDPMASRRYGFDF